MIDSKFGGAMLLALWLAAPGLSLAQEEAAMVRRSTELREQPADAARVLAPLPQDTAVTRLAERQGAWLRVRTATGTIGWVHMFDIGAPGGATASASSGASGMLRGVTGFFTKPTQTTVSTSTIGIRGLGAEDLARAQPDTAAVGRMEGLRATEQQARQFARDAQLAPSNVEPLPAPPRPAANPSQGGQQ